MKSENCPTCGKPLDASTLMGLCPECLLKAGFGTIDSEGKTAPFVTPAPADLAHYFPELEIRGLIGQGGMGAVYEARQTRLDRIVALKILPPNVSQDSAFGERFEREARALAQLHHPNIVTLYESGQRDGLFYFLMEFVDGMNLRQLLDTGHVTPQEALAIVPQICDALQFAHDRGIIHRDIKPENILLNRSGQVKIADFGVAKLIAHQGPPANNVTAAPGQTAAGAVVGTPQYMAPEQLTRPQDVDNRADIYALGVVFYQMLTGELPAGKFEPPSRKVQIDVRLDEVVLRALEKNPDLRFPRASQFKTQIETITIPPPPSPTSSAQKPEKTARGTVVLRFGLGLFALAVFLILGLFGLKQWRPASPPKVPPVSTVTSRGSARSPFPLCKNNQADKNSALVYYDKVDLDYVLYYPGRFEASVEDAHARGFASWTDEGRIRLENGKNFSYLRQSTSPLSLRINGQDYDLRRGRIIVLKDEGQCSQYAYFPPLAVALNREELARVIDDPYFQKREVPELRFLAWQSETKNDSAPAAWTPDGQWATSEADLKQIKDSPASRVEVKGQPAGSPQARYLFLWFSGFDIDDRNSVSVKLLDANEKPLNANGNTASGIARKGNGFPAWFTYTASPGNAGKLPSRVTIRLDYSSGPWTIGPDIATDFHGSIALRSGAFATGVGQDFEGKAFIPISINRTINSKTQFNFVAFLKDGRSLEPSRLTAGGQQDGGVQMQRFTFDSPLQDILSFQCRTREIRTVTFESIPLMQE